MVSSLPPKIISESPEKSSTDYERTINRVAEIALCAVDPAYFIQKYVKIQDKVRQKEVPFHLFPYQQELLQALLHHKKIIILKARQLGVSWLIVAYCLWKAIFQSNTKVLFLSRKEATAAELVGGGTGMPGKAKFIWANLPSWMTPKLGKDTEEALDFRDINSSLQALASVPEAGRSTDATIIVRDELTYHPCAEQNFSAILPAVSRGGQLIDLSTADRTRVEYHFKTRYQQARRGEIDVHKIFLSRELEKYYLDIVGIDYEKWIDEQKKELGALFESEYPLTEDEALSITESRRYFDIQALSDLSLNVTVPLKLVDGLDLRNGLIRVYKPRAPGEKYVIYTDPSMGKDDPSHTIVIKASTKEEVCSANYFLPADDAAVIHDSLVRYYNNAQNSFEYNAMAGGVFRITIAKLATPNVILRHNPKGKAVQGEYGIYVTPYNKKEMLSVLASGINRRQYIIHDAETIDEFNTMMFIEGEDIPRVPNKMHDDRIMAWAGAIDCCKYVILGNAFKIESGFYRD